MDPITRKLVETVKKITEDTITTTPSSTPPSSLPPINSKILAPDWMKDAANTGRLLKLQDKLTDPTGVQSAMDDYVISAQDALDKKAQSKPQPRPQPQQPQQPQPPKPQSPFA